MARKEKQPKSPEHIGFKEVFGATALSTNNGLAAIFMSTMFMQYMTDYAGLGTLGATLATTLLFAARIIDAVDDPIQGFIMDNAKPGKHGKYKPFFLLSIIMTTVGIACLYALPDSITTKPALVTVWVIFFYFLYDIGASFYNQNLLFRTMTNDASQRNKLLIGPRLWVMILGMMGAGLTAIVVAIQKSTGSFKTAYMVLAFGAMGIAGLLSLLGWFMVKERHIVEQDPDDRVKLADFIELFKENKAMVVNFFKNLFTGFVWTFLFATPTYYVRYAYCFDAATGVVDYEKLSTYSLIVSMMMLLPLLAGTAISTPILKAFKYDFVKMHRFSFLMEGLGGLVLFAAQMLGILEKVPALFFFGMFFMGLFIGVNFLPGQQVEMEIMDYTVYKTGKDRSALTGVLTAFLNKGQSAISTALVGAVLIAIGYNVDSVSGNYVGELSRIPALLDWMVIIMAGIPFVLAIVGGVLIMGKYPVDAEERAKMKAFLESHETTGEE